MERVQTEDMTEAVLHSILPPACVLCFGSTAKLLVLAHNLYGLSGSSVAVTVVDTGRSDQAALRLIECQSKCLDLIASKS